MITALRVWFKASKAITELCDTAHFKPSQNIRRKSNRAFTAHCVLPSILVGLIICFSGSGSEQQWRTSASCCCGLSPSQ